MARRPLRFAINHVENLHHSVRGACRQAFTVVIQLGIVLTKSHEYRFQFYEACKTRTIMSSWAVSMGTESDTVAAAFT